MFASKSQKPKYAGSRMAYNVLLMRSRGSLTAAIWRSPNDRQGVKRISFVVRMLARSLIGLPQLG